MTKINRPQPLFKGTEQHIPQFHSHRCAHETVRPQIFWVAVPCSPHTLFFYQGSFALLLKAEHGDRQKPNVTTESAFEKNLSVSLVLSKKTTVDSASKAWSRLLAPHQSKNIWTAVFLKPYKVKVFLYNRILHLIAPFFFKFVTTCFVTP